MAEARQHLLAQVVFVIQRTPAPAYNTVAVSCDRASLQRGGQFARLHRFTMLWTTRPSALAAGSRVCASLQRRGRLAVRAGLQKSRPIHPSTPVYYAVAGSPVSDFNFT